MRTLLTAALLLALWACDAPDGDTLPAGTEVAPPADLNVTYVRTHTVGVDPGTGSDAGIARAATSSLTATGTVVSDQLARPSSKTGGLLTAVLVREGDDVRRGQTIARLDVTELDAGVAQARAGLEKARRDLARVEALFADSVATRTQRDDAATGVEVAERRLEALEFNRAQNVIAAPVSGRIAQKLANAGETVGPGQPVAVIQGTAPGDWRVRVGLTDAQWASTAVGQSAVARFDAFPGRRFAARLTERATAADPASGTFPVELRLAEQPPSLAAGLVAEVEFAAASTSTPADIRAPSTFHVPLAALGRVSGKRAEVFVVDGAGRARAREVQLGSARATAVEVLDGLGPGDRLITTGVAWLRDGDAVRIAAE